MTFEQLRDKAKKIDLNKIMDGIIKSLEPEIIDLNIAQMSKGEGASGSKFPQYANDDYYNAKKAEGLTEQAGRYYNIRLSGDTRENMFLKKESGEFVISSTVDYVGRLRALTDDDLFGLQENNLQQLIDDRIENETVEELEKALT